MISGDRVSLARQALRAAIDIRKRTSVPRRSPICVFDLCENIGIEVRFAKGSSFEGIFSKTTNTIIVPSERPPGRQAFSCAHELGHWYFKHGSTIDELDSPKNLDSKSPQELLASLFAGYLIMPPWTVKNAFDVRAWSPQCPASHEVYTVAGQLGVGYTSLVTHMHHSLELVDRKNASRLLSTAPKQIRAELLSHIDCPHLIIVDKYWDVHMPVDLRVGDYIVVPNSASVTGNIVSDDGVQSDRTVYVARRPGIGQLTGPNFACFLRVRRMGFVGRSIYRHLEDPDVDRTT